jgi:hypothetical protein
MTREDYKLHTRRRENLKSHIVNSYGEAILRCVGLFESFRITFRPDDGGSTHP